MAALVSWYQCSAKYRDKTWEWSAAALPSFLLIRTHLRNFSLCSLEVCLPFPCDLTCKTTAWGVLNKDTRKSSMPQALKHLTTALSTVELCHIRQMSRSLSLLRNDTFFFSGNTGCSMYLHYLPRQWASKLSTAQWCRGRSLFIHELLVADLSGVSFLKIKLHDFLTSSHC